MIGRIAFLPLLLASVGVSAQILPTPGYDNPRIQQVPYTPGEEVILTALPETGLTVVLDPHETITRVMASQARQFDISVSPELNSLQVAPLLPSAASNLSVETDRRNYRFQLRVDQGLTAAYLVRFDYGATTSPPLPDAIVGLDAPQSQAIWPYRLRGDRSVHPLEVSDDGVKTRIRYAADQALPAVFAISPTGDEEVVNGYMRDGVFVIDRVYDELVFRIDKAKARAQRGDQRGAQGGAQVESEG